MTPPEEITYRAQIASGAIPSLRHSNEASDVVLGRRPDGRYWCGGRRPLPAPRCHRV